MTVCVDDVRHRFGRMKMSHMWADSDEELHAMAAAIGVARRWFQQPPKASWKHYDRGGEPYVQPYMKLNALEKRPHVRFDWTERKLRRLQRWANGRFWKYATSRSATCTTPRCSARARSGGGCE